MKCFADYLVYSANQVEREILHDTLGVEVPYLECSYRNWFLKNNGNENTLRSYISNLKGLDKDIFACEDDDFFLLLKTYFEEEKWDEIVPLFDKFDTVIKEWKSESEKSDIGITTKHINDLYSAFNSYRAFFEWLISTDKATVDTGRKRHLFLEEEFIDWCEDNGISQRSASSYISNIHRINDAFFSQLKDGKECNIDFLPQTIKKHGESISSILLEMKGMLSSEISTKREIRGIKYNSLHNCHTAFGNYVKFLLEYLADYFAPNHDDQESEPENIHIGGKLFDDSEILCLDYETMEAQLRFRMITQDRTSGSIFYPIDLLKRLFYCDNTQYRPYHRSTRGSNTRWFDKWIADCIAEIQVITTDGIYILADFDMFEISPKDRIFHAFDGNGKRHTVMTKDHKGNTMDFKATGIGQISIDHSPLLKDVLTSNAESLPAMKSITSLLKRITGNGEKSISEAYNIALIEHFGELNNLIEPLKTELNLIRRNSRLELMEKCYNLKKK